MRVPSRAWSLLVTTTLVAVLARPSIAAGPAAAVDVLVLSRRTGQPIRGASVEATTLKELPPAWDLLDCLTDARNAAVTNETGSARVTTGARGTRLRVTAAGHAPSVLVLPPTTEWLPLRVELADARNVHVVGAPMPRRASIYGPSGSGDVVTRIGELRLSAGEAADIATTIGGFVVVTTEDGRAIEVRDGGAGASGLREIDIRLHPEDADPTTCTFRVQPAEARGSVPPELIQEARVSSLGPLRVIVPGGAWLLGVECAGAMSDLVPLTDTASVQLDLAAATTLRVDAETGELTCLMRGARGRCSTRPFTSLLPATATAEILTTSWRGITERSAATGDETAPRAARRITARVMDEVGEPVAGARCLVEDLGRELRLPCDLASNAVHGNGLGEGEHVLWLDAPGMVRRAHPFRLETSDGARHLGDIVLQRAATLQGRVTDSLTLAPVARAEVSAGHGDRSPPVARGMTDEEGRFALPGLQPGSFLIAVSAAGYARTKAVPCEALAGAPPSCDISVAPLGGIRVTVLDDEGRPLEHRKVDCKRLSRGGIARHVSSATTEAGGIAVFPELEPADYEVSRGDREDRSVRCEVSAGATTIIELSESNCCLRGRVLRGGVPTEAMVRLARPGPLAMDASRASTIYEACGFDPGVVALEVSGLGPEGAWRQPVSLRMTRCNTEVDIELPADDAESESLSTLRGATIDEETGAALLGLRVRIWGPMTDQVVDATSGSFELDLPSGRTYSMTVEPDALDSCRGSRIVEVELVPAMDAVEVPARCWPMQLVTVLGDGGQPLAGVNVEAVATPCGDEFCSTGLGRWTDGSGRVRVLLPERDDLHAMRIIDGATRFGFAGSRSPVVTLPGAGSLRVLGGDAISLRPADPPGVPWLVLRRDGAGELGRFISAEGASWLVRGVFAGVHDVRIGNSVSRVVVTANAETNVGPRP